MAACGLSSKWETRLRGPAEVGIVVFVVTASAGWVLLAWTGWETTLTRGDWSLCGLADPVGGGVCSGGDDASTGGTAGCKIGAYLCIYLPINIYQYNRALHYIKIQI